MDKETWELAQKLRKTPRHHNILGEAKYNIGKRVKAAKPEFERYAALVQQFKDKSKKRKALPLTV